MKTKKLVGKYFGPNKIVSCYAFQEEKTYLGKGLTMLVFENGVHQAFPDEVIDTVVTKQPIDLSDLRDKRVKPVIEKILVILLESELKKEDMEYVINVRLQASIQQSLNLAQEKIWGKKGYEVTLMDIEQVLTGNKEKKAKRKK